MLSVVGDASFSLAAVVVVSPGSAAVSVSFDAAEDDVAGVAEPPEDDAGPASSPPQPAIINGRQTATVISDEKLAILMVVSAPCRELVGRVSFGNVAVSVLPHPMGKRLLLIVYQTMIPSRSRYPAARAGENFRLFLQETRKNIESEGLISGFN